MANEKIIAQDVFEQSIKDILTLLVNNTYNFTEYTDEEVGNLIDLDQTQIAELTAVISDSVVAKNKVFSSSHTTELIQKSVIESNEYADSLVANLSNIKLDIVDTLPDASTINKSTIYILKDSTGGTNNTLNVWSDSTSAFVEVGKLDVNMDSYYTKTDVDTLLADKADDNTVVHQDDVVTDMTTTSGTTVLSTSGLKTELDKKANDDEVVKTADIKTTLDENSTNDEVYGGKAIFDAIHESISMTLSSASDITALLAKLKSLAPRKNAVIKLYDASGILFPVTGNYIGTVSVINRNEIIVICVNHWNSKHAYTFRVQNDDTSISLNKICTTSVLDVPETRIVFSANTNYEGKATSIYSNYEVADGICYVLIYAKCLAPTNSWISINDSLPRPKRFVFKSLSALANATDSLNCTINKGGNMSLRGGTANGEYITTFSYHVAES